MTEASSNRNLMLDATTVRRPDQAKDAPRGKEAPHHRDNPSNAIEPLRLRCANGVYRLRIAQSSLNQSEGSEKAIEAGVPIVDKKIASVQPLLRLESQRSAKPLHSIATMLQIVGR